MKISPILIQEIVNRLVAGLAPEQIILFGSQAWGQPHQGSDLDIMIIVTKSSFRPAERARQAYALLHGLNIPKDILVKTRAEFEKYKNVPASLEAKINNRGIKVYG